MRPALIAAGAAFLLGSAATFYIARELEWVFADETVALAAPEEQAAGEPTAEVAGASEPEPSNVETVAQARQAARRVEEVVEQQGGLDQRLAAMEQRLARLDLQAQAAAGNVARAESLLIAFAARRAIERGAPLGYLGDQLRLRFGDALPNAVAAVRELGENPITVDQLIARLEALAPQLAETPSGEGLLPRIGRELSQLFVIRTEETPSPRAESRLERARLFLESGRVSVAAAEVANMPNSGEAAEWIADAERYARAQQALELLETTAILEPRRLRDGSGNLVEQPSPAG